MKRKKKADKFQFDFDKELAYLDVRKKPLIQYVTQSKKSDIFTYESIKILIDHGWDHAAYDFFKTQFWVFLTFFIFPFGIDLYSLNYVVNDQELTLPHVVFNIVALACQFAFLLNECV